MALILAIEPDRRQASKVAAIVKNKLHADIVQADTTEHGVDALGGRVPDLILTSLLLSRKDDAALADWLRESDEAGRHVQTLVIPVLAGSSRDDDEGGGLLSRFTRGRSRDDATTDGCDPEVFAAQIREYLERAAEEQRHRLEDAEAAKAAAESGRAGVTAAADRIPLRASSPAPDPAPALQARSWDQPYADGTGSAQLQHFEMEAVAPEPLEPAPADAPVEPSDDDAWSEISLGEHTEVDASAIGGNYLLDEDDGAPLELNSEPIDLQRFVEELTSDVSVERTPAPRRSDNVLAEFEDALEVIEEPSRPVEHSEADSDVRPDGAAARPHLDSTVAKPAAADPPAAAPAAARPRSRKKSRAAAPQAEWNLFDPEQCGFSALLAKLDQMAD